MLGFSLLLALRVKADDLVNILFYRLPTRLRRRPGKANAAGRTGGGWRGGVPAQSLGGNVSVRAAHTVSRTSKEALLLFGLQIGVPRLFLETCSRGLFE